MAASIFTQLLSSNKLLLVFIHAKSCPERPFFAHRRTHTYTQAPAPKSQITDYSKQVDIYLKSVFAMKPVQYSERCVCCETFSYSQRCVCCETCTVLTKVCLL